MDVEEEEVEIKAEEVERASEKPKKKKSKAKKNPFDTPSKGNKGLSYRRSVQKVADRRRARLAAMTEEEREAHRAKNAESTWIRRQIQKEHGPQKKYVLTDEQKEKVRISAPLKVSSFKSLLCLFSTSSV